MAITILYVDDEPINLMLFEQWFNKKYSVLTAESGKQGLEILQKQPEIKVVISDMRMPGMSGIEFIKKANTMFSNIIFFILTGYEITKEIQESLENGLITRYFQKPFNLQDIDVAIGERIRPL